jgi:hypothetical protein
MIRTNDATALDVVSVTSPEESVVWVSRAEAPSGAGNPFEGLLAKSVAAQTST